MTEEEALKAMENGTRVQAGEGEDHDTGLIHELYWEGERLMARVGWDSCQESHQEASDLEPA